MPIIHGSLNRTELAGTSLKQDERGMISISASFGFQDYSTAVAFLELRGDSLSGATRTSASMDTDGSGLWAVQCTYDKASPNEDEDKEEAESTIKSLDITIKEIAITLHPKFEALKKKYGWDAEKKAFPDTYVTPAIKTPIRSPMAGVENYMVTGVSYTAGSSYQEIPPAIYEGISKILDGDPPGLSSLGFSRKANQTWIYMAPKIKQKGAGYEVEQTWQLSGDDGWNTEIYDKAANAAGDDLQRVNEARRLAQETLKPTQQEANYADVERLLRAPAPAPVPRPLTPAEQAAKIRAKYGTR